MLFSQMLPDSLWQAATKNMERAISLCTTHPGASPSFAIELLRESAEMFGELLPQKPRMLQQTLGEFLFAAVHAKKPDAASALLSVGAYVDWRAEDSLTPLHHAAEVNNPALVSMLAKAGADLEMQVGNGKQYYGTALHVAIDRRALDALLALISAGANVNAVESEETGNTALHCAAGGADVRDSAKEALLLSATRLVKALISAGADITLRNRRGELALTTASDCGNTSASLALLGASTYSTDDLMMPLFSAILGNDHSIIEALVEAGADLTRKAKIGEEWKTPIEHAESLGNAGTIEFVRSLTAQVGVERSLGRAIAASENPGQPQKSLSPL
jgi:ankyrin repeat protein